jgi:hypothetical protein
MALNVEYLISKYHFISSTIMKKSYCTHQGAGVGTALVSELMSYFLSSFCMQVCIFKTTTGNRLNYTDLFESTVLGHGHISITKHGF